MPYHTLEEMQEFAKKYNMTVEELEQHLKDHGSMDYQETHRILMAREYTDQELEIMAREHHMSLEQLREHIAFFRAHG